jgi:hypothetical protein
VIAAPQEVVLVEGESFAGELVSVGDDGVVAFRGGRAERTAAEAASPGVVEVKRDDVVRWGNPVSPRGRTIVVLADGGQLVTAADWSGGGAVQFDGEKFVVLSDAFGEVTLQRDDVRGFVFAQLRHAAERAKMVQRVLEAPSPDPSLKGRGSFSPEPSLNGRGSLSAVLLSNGDRVSGKLTGVDRGSLTLETNGAVAKLPLSRVEAVAIGRQPSAVSRQARYAVGLRDGSLLYVGEVVANEKELRLKIGDAITLSGGNVEDVVFLQSLGGRGVYLSDLEPAEYRHVPYLDLAWPLARDRNVLGESLVVGGKRYLKGLGMHSAGRVSYRLDEKYTRFEATVAMDDSANGRGSVTFGVYLLRDGKLSEAYESGIVRGGDAPQRVSVDVAGAQGITLVVDFAERGDEMDRADWLDARLMRE